MWCARAGWSELKNSYAEGPLWTTHKLQIYVLCYFCIYDWLFKLKSKKKGNICTVSLFTQQSVSATVGCKKGIFTDRNLSWLT